MDLLSAEQAAVYWDARHRDHTALRSGGHISYDEATNQMFYTRRLSILLDVLGHHCNPVAPLFILDAGCGKGWFSRELARFGHDVEGIDPSETALTYARAQGGGPRYTAATLSGWRSPWLYDVVASIDVLFHVLDDAEWERSVRNLASLVRLRGRLIVSDWGEDGVRAYGDYQVVRGRDWYVPLLKSCGLSLDGWRPFQFRGSPIGFYVFTRTG